MARQCQRSVSTLCVSALSVTYNQDQRRDSENAETQRVEWKTQDVSFALTRRTRNSPVRLVIASHPFTWKRYFASRNRAIKVSYDQMFATEPSGNIAI